MAQTRHGIQQFSFVFLSHSDCLFPAFGNNATVLVSYNIKLSGICQQLMPKIALIIFANFCKDTLKSAELFGVNAICDCSDYV